MGQVGGGGGLGVGESLNGGGRQLVLLVVLLALSSLRLEEQILFLLHQDWCRVWTVSHGDNVQRRNCALCARYRC